MANQDYIAKNKAWLAAKASEPGVHTLDKGILYKVIRRGKPDGVHPNRNSVVTAHYTGKTINGKTFDSSRGGVAPAFRLRELIPELDNSTATDGARRQMGNLHTRRAGIWTLQPTGHSRRLHSYF